MNMKDKPNEFEKLIKILSVFFSFRELITFLMSSQVHKIIVPITKVIRMKLIKIFLDFGGFFCGTLQKDKIKKLN